MLNCEFDFLAMSSKKGERTHINRAKRDCPFWLQHFARAVVTPRSQVGVPPKRMQKMTIACHSVFLIAVLSVVCSCRETSRPTAASASGSNLNTPMFPGVFDKQPHYSVKERVDLADLIVIANISLVFGSKNKSVLLENIEVLRGKIPAGKEVQVTLEVHPLVWPPPATLKRKLKYIFFLAKPIEVTSDLETRPLIGEKYDPDGIVFATDDYVQKVHEAIRSASQDSK